MQKKEEAIWKIEWLDVSKSEEQTESQMRDQWDNVKHVNLHRTGIPEREEREKGIENVFKEIMVENFPNLKKETDIQVQEAQRIPSKINPNKQTYTKTYYNENGKS